MNNFSLFSSVERAPRDPILGLNEAFNADVRNVKVNLGVGVYCDDTGKIPLLKAVKKAEEQLVQTGASRGYLPIEGIATYNQNVQKLVFGRDSAVLNNEQVITVQALGGTGALKIGADFIKRLKPNAQVLISDPSWENHRALFESAGFKVDSYPYYQAETHGINFSAMLETLSQASADTVIVLHACCHNPTGVDLTIEQWKQVVAVCKTRALIPFLDMAYQGFAENIEIDRTAVRLFAEADINFFVSSSFSKSFSLYGERVGALSLVAASKDEAGRVLSQLKRIIRTNYSNPPTHGAMLVATILNTPELQQLWEQELNAMRDRIRTMRTGLVEGLKTRGITQDFSFVVDQRGMFSYSGLTSNQVDQLRTEYGIYAVSTGRICLAAMNSKNLEYVVDAIAAILKT